MSRVSGAALRARILSQIALVAGLYSYEGFVFRHCLSSRNHRHSRIGTSDRRGNCHDQTLLRIFSLGLPHSPHADRWLEPGCNACDWRWAHSDDPWNFGRHGLDADVVRSVLISWFAAWLGDAATPARETRNASRCARELPESDSLDNVCRGCGDRISLMEAKP